MKYNPAIVCAYFKGCGLTEPILEYKFHSVRKWRFDFAWFALIPIPNMPDFVEIDGTKGVALEVDGGIWIGGGHNRGAQIKKTWEKENEAQILGWKVLKVEPKDLCTESTVDMLKRALGI